MRKVPFISIITVVFNGEKYLEQTIQSVINQTYKNLEYIIIDGGSTDKTLDIIKQYESHISHWVSEPDKGLYDAMNKGIRIAKGELIGMVNSDDWYELNTVKFVVDKYKKESHCTIFHGDRYDVNELGERRLFKFNKSIFKFKYYGMTYNHPGMFVSKDEYREHLYNNELNSVADFQFILEAFMKDKSKFCYIEQPLANFRLGGISSKLTPIAALREGYMARKNAGFSFLQNLFSMTMRIIYWSVSYLLNFMKG